MTTNMQPIHPPLPAFHVACIDCGKVATHADLKGKAFQAYYCAVCAKKREAALCHYTSHETRGR